MTYSIHKTADLFLKGRGKTPLTENIKACGRHCTVAL